MRFSPSLSVVALAVFVLAGMYACGGPVNSDGDGQDNQTGTSEDVCGDAPRFDVAKLANDARSEEGRDPLICDTRLVEAANAHAADMCENNFLGHTSSDGRSAGERIRNALDGEVTWSAENAAQGARSADRVHDLWMQSSGHRRNILAEPAVRIGVGYDECDGGHYWVQKFAAP